MLFSSIAVFLSSFSFGVLNYNIGISNEFVSIGMNNFSNSEDLAVEDTICNDNYAYLNTSIDLGDYYVSQTYSYEVMLTNRRTSTRFFGITVDWDNNDNSYSLILKSYLNCNLYVDNLSFSLTDSEDEYYFTVSYFKFLYSNNESTVIYEGFSDNLPNLSITSMQIHLVSEEDFTIISNNDNTSYYDSGYSNGYTTGRDEGYQSGYADAKATYENQSAVANSIFSGILDIGLLPVEFLMSIFNFEIFGIKITYIVSALLSMMVVVIILRVVLGGKGGTK